jgi:hypothetical protein
MCYTKLGFNDHKGVFMSLTKFPASAINWDDLAHVPTEHALFVAAAPLLSKWIESIKAAHLKLTDENTWPKRDAILLAEAQSRLGNYVTKMVNVLSLHATAPCVTDRAKGLPITALKIKEWFLFGLLFDSFISGLDEQTCDEIRRLCQLRASVNGAVSPFGNTVRVVELGAFGLRLKFASAHRGRPSWVDAWETPLEPVPGLARSEGLERCLAMTGQNSGG